MTWSCTAQASPSTSKADIRLSIDHPRLNKVRSSRKKRTTAQSKRDTVRSAGKRNSASSVNSREAQQCQKSSLVDPYTSTLLTHSAQPSLV